MEPTPREFPFSPRVHALVAKRADVIDTLKEILTEHLGLRMPAPMIDLDVPLFGSGLGLDSVDALELVVAIEDAFRIRMPQEIIRPSMRTLNTLVDLVIAMRGEPS